MAFALADGRYQSTPFTPEVIADGRRLAAGVLGLAEAELEVTRGQPFCLGLVAAVLKEGRDPDWEWFPSLAEGVDLDRKAIPEVAGVCSPWTFLTQSWRI